MAFEKLEQSNGQSPSPHPAPSLSTDPDDTAGH